MQSLRASMFFVLLLTVSLIHGQAKLSFIEESHDFGEIREEDGFAEHTFQFVNDGDQPIKISQVKASCGCTTPGWTREEIMPGDSGFVKARYNPRNRPGKFRKSLRITTNEASANKVLYISGFVKPKPKTVEEEYPVATGNLRLKYRSLNMGKMTTEKPVEKTFDVYNGGSDSLQLMIDQMKVPAHIALVLQPETLGPKAKGQLVVSYDPVKKNDLGFISDNVTIVTDTLYTENLEFNVLCTIEEYFPPLSGEELDRAPKLALNERIYDFGKVQSGEPVTAEFTITNDGKEKLNFRKIKSNCSCVTYEWEEKNLKKGKSGVLKVVFDTTGRRGNQYKTVTIFSNDPVAPTQMVTIKGIVQFVK